MNDIHPCWQVLAIEPTTDQRAIRRAYAKKLKTIDQDLEPARFIALRDALDAAFLDAEYGIWAESSIEEANIDLNTQTVDQPAAASIAWHVDLSIGYQQVNLNVDVRNAKPLDPPLRTTEPEILTQSAGTETRVADGTAAWLPNQAAQAHLRRQVDDLRERLWAGQYDGASYVALEHILRHLSDQSLALQMEIQEQLRYALAWSPEQPKTDCFIQCWVQALGLDAQSVAWDEAEDRLQQRWSEIEARQQFWQKIPAQYTVAIQQLVTGTQLSWWSMWQLSGANDPYIKALRQQHWQTVPQLQVNRAQNLPLQLVLRLRAYGSYAMTLVLVFVATWALLSQWASLTFQLIWVWPAFGFVLLWHWLIQAPINAWLAASPRGDVYRSGLFGGWLITGLLLLAFSAALPLGVLMGLLWGWTLLLALWLGDANVYSPSAPLVPELIEVCQIRVDRWWVAIATIVLTIGIVMLVQLLFDEVLNGVVPEAVASSFALLPLALMFFRSYVYQQLAQMILLMRAVPERLDQWMMYCLPRWRDFLHDPDQVGKASVVVGVIGLGLVMVFALLWWGMRPIMLHMNTALALMMIGLSALLIAPSSRILALAVKHLAYLSGIIGLLLIWYWTGETIRVVLLVVYASIAWVVGYWWLATLRADRESSIL
ncbi:MAG: hypothetical protein VXW65_07930 [Pseudomonadota bacterium]|nr:hypothetical protein [Pseudomonadota bacterium]